MSFATYVATESVLCSHTSAQVQLGRMISIEITIGQTAAAHERASHPCKNTTAQHPSAHTCDIDDHVHFTSTRDIRLHRDLASGALFEFLTPWPFDQGHYTVKLHRLTLALYGNCEPGIIF